MRPNVHDLVRLIISTSDDVFLDRMSPADHDAAIESAMQTFLSANAHEPEWALLCDTFARLPAERREAVLKFVVKAVDAAQAATAAAALMTASLSRSELQ